MIELIHEIERELKKNLTEARYTHVLGVKELCCYLGRRYRLDVDKLCLAALLHDFAKFYTAEELTEYCVKESIKMAPFEEGHHGFLHSKVGHHIAGSRYHIKDIDVLNPILYHTTGRPNMSIYEEIMFISDYCEPNRNIKNKQDIIQEALHSTKRAVLLVLRGKLGYVLTKNLGIIHPRSIDAYNWYVQSESHLL